jgi:hypothetical protein
MRGTNRTIKRIARFLLLAAVFAALSAAPASAAGSEGELAPPSIRTLKPDGVSESEAILLCEDSPRGHDLVIRFQYGRTKEYGRITWVPEEDPYPYYQHQEFEEWVDGLKPNTTYHYRAEATFEGQKIYGKDVAFKTQRPFKKRRH